MFPLEFRADVNRQETRVMGLSSSEDLVIVAGSFWHDTSMWRMVRRSDSWTESIIANTVLCIACYADAP